jgi:hypothetical protein
VEGSSRERKAKGRRGSQKNLVGDGDERYGSVSELGKSQLWTRKNRSQTNNTGMNEKEVRKIKNVKKKLE